MASAAYQARRKADSLQPQVDDWKNYQELDARLAFTLTPANGQSHVGW